MLKPLKSVNLGFSTSSIRKTREHIPKVKNIGFNSFNNKLILTFLVSQSTSQLDSPAIYNSFSKIKSAINLNE